jgi:predicted porin
MSESLDGTDPAISLGMKYNFNENFSSILDVERLRADLDGVSGDLDTISLGLTYSF